MRSFLTTDWSQGASLDFKRRSEIHIRPAEREPLAVQATQKSCFLTF